MDLLELNKVKLGASKKEEKREKERERNVNCKHIS
jgi:hypothetical protein